MDPASSRVEWWELQPGDVLYVVGEWTPKAGWEFWEKTTWEIRWHPVAPTAALITKAQEILAET